MFAFPYANVVGQYHVTRGGSAIGHRDEGPSREGGNFSDSSTATIPVFTTLTCACCESTWQVAADFVKSTDAQLMEEIAVEHFTKRVLRSEEIHLVNNPTVGADLDRCSRALGSITLCNFCVNYFVESEKRIMVIQKNCLDKMNCTRDFKQVLADPWLDLKKFAYHKLNGLEGVITERLNFINRIFSRASPERNSAANTTIADSDGFETDCTTMSAPPYRGRKAPRTKTLEAAQETSANTESSLRSPSLRTTKLDDSVIFAKKSIPAAVEVTSSPTPADNPNGKSSSDGFETDCTTSSAPPCRGRRAPRPRTKRALDAIQENRANSESSLSSPSPKSTKLDDSVIVAKKSVPGVTQVTCSSPTPADNPINKSNKKTILEKSSSKPSPKVIECSVNGKNKVVKASNKPQTEEKGTETPPRTPRRMSESKSPKKYVTIGSRKVSDVSSSSSSSEDEDCDDDPRTEKSSTKNYV